MRHFWSVGLSSLLMITLATFPLLVSGYNYEYLCAKEMRKKGSKVLHKRLMNFYSTFQDNPSLIKSHGENCSSTSVTGMAFAHIQLLFVAGLGNNNRTGNSKTGVKRQEKYVDDHKAFLLPMFQALSGLKDMNGSGPGGSFQPCSFYGRNAKGHWDGLVCMNLTDAAKTKELKKPSFVRKCVWCGDRYLEYYNLTDQDRNGTERLCKLVVSSKDAKGTRIRDLDDEEVIPRVKKSKRSAGSAGINRKGIKDGGGIMIIMMTGIIWFTMIGMNRIEGDFGRWG